MARAEGFLVLLEALTELQNRATEGHARRGGHWRDFPKCARRCRHQLCYCSSLFDIDEPLTVHAPASQARVSHVDTSSETCVLYHSYVEAIPRSSGIWACQPRAWMRDTSSNLRGVPSGREGSKTIRPV